MFVFQLMSPSTAFRIPESQKHTAQSLTSVLDAKVSALPSTIDFFYTSMLLCAEISVKKRRMVKMKGYPKSSSCPRMSALEIITTFNDKIIIPTNHAWERLICCIASVA